MLLSNAKITNFRSIKEIQLPFRQLGTCLVFVGINESGKSNILRALRHLDESQELTAKDLRVPLSDEPIISEASIHYELDLDSWEKEFISGEVSTITNVNPTTQILVGEHGHNYDLQALINKLMRFVYVVDVKAKTKALKYYSKVLDSKCLLASHIKGVLPVPNIPANIIEIDGQKKYLSSLKLVDERYIPETHRRYLRDITAQEAYDMLASWATECLKSYTPKVVYWQYRQSLNLPSSVSIDAFKGNHDTCLPLKYMFHIAGVSSISEEIGRAQDAGTNQLRNLFDRVADRTTKYFRKRWKEYKNFTFSLSLNSANLDISIRDHNNHYDFADRSDGFRRFASFLLLISGRIEAEETSDTILLIDEPEGALHPSAARFLRDELINISKDIPVYFATHSLFMIDSEHIERHFIVKKDKEVTVIEQATQGNLHSEEVIYRSMGFSLKEIIGEKSIIFEGYYDKLFFRNCISASLLPDDLKEWRTCHVGGVREISKFAVFFELAHQKCYLMTDADEAAMREKKTHEDKELYGKWTTYRDHGKAWITTLEDFLVPDYFHSKIMSVLNSRGLSIEIARADIEAPGKGRMRLLKEVLTANLQIIQQRGIAIDDIIKEIKRGLFITFDKSVVSQDYIDMFKSFVENGL